MVTPVIKAAFTHQAFYGDSECLQVFGGHGYVREWGIEQIVRDARLAMIYEGINEIQAIDLLVRKVLPDGAAALTTLLHELGEANHELVRACAHDPALAYWVADDYLRAVALALLAWAWARIDAGLRSSADQDRLSPRWQAPAQALFHWVLPEFDMRMNIVLQGCRSASTTTSI